MVALPTGLWAATRWLEAYPDHVRVGPGIVMIAGIVVAATAALAMAHQVWRAARMDPVQALRSE